MPLRQPTLSTRRQRLLRSGAGLAPAAGLLDLVRPEGLTLIPACEPLAAGDRMVARGERRKAPLHSIASCYCPRR
jgi:hypothetical protein